jgi:hypothetical protein
MFKRTIGKNQTCLPAGRFKTQKQKQYWLLPIDN